MDRFLRARLSFMSSADSPPEVPHPDDLYSLPLEQFIAARDRLNARLAAEGQTDQAMTVAKLRKPSVAAWALNRASRTRPDAVERLVASHHRLRAASSTELLHEASEERRKAVVELEAVALAELTADGRPISGTIKDRIASTLLAVATDSRGEEDLVAGRLVREIALSGAGWGDIWLAPLPAEDPAVRAKAAAERARARADRLRSEAESAEQQVELAQRALVEAKRRAKEAMARAEEAAAEAQEAEAAVGKAKRS
jgi:hypothetical protein